METHSVSANIRIADYLTELPDKKLLEKKLHQSIERAKNKLTQHLETNSAKKINEAISTKIGKDYSRRLAIPLLSSQIKMPFFEQDIFISLKCHL